MWRTISRGTDEIEEICNKTEENLHVSKNDTYRKIDLYEETATWSALQEPPKMFDVHDPKEVSSNIVEVIRTVLKFFFFFFYLFIYLFFLMMMIRFHKHKKAQSKIKNMYGKHLRGKELLILYLLLMLLLSCAFMLFSAFLCFFLLVKSYHKKKINKQKV